MSIETVLVNLRKCVTPSSWPPRQPFPLLHLSDPLGACLCLAGRWPTPTTERSLSLWRVPSSESPTPFPTTTFSTSFSRTSLAPPRLSRM